MSTSSAFWHRRRASTVAVAAAAALAVMTAAGCDDAKDAASSATSAAGSAAAAATDKASSAVAAATSSAPSSTAPDSSAVLGSPTASAPPAPAVPSTSIDSPDGKPVSITDPAIIAEYAARGYDKGYLGKPLGPVVGLVDGGKFETFEGGSIYYNPAVKKAFSVHGAIGGFWGKSGHEAGTLGYPAGEETPTDKGLEQKFDRGTLLDADGTVTTISN
ncbi:LGFP repeat-containing protein [Williamsia maris]|uniref:LGFP repeat-containing protein n=1 Tax=Williamsia maris TaxID=72806 RepID=A0ABT1HJC3_9NOCA|nr:hypothetical protein [Williamsia maris]MCP2178032.1 LGFP repeat-containing protein [Williamsia maris]